MQWLSERLPEIKEIHCLSFLALTLACLVALTPTHLFGFSLGTGNQSGRLASDPALQLWDHCLKPEMSTLDTVSPPGTWNSSRWLPSPHRSGTCSVSSTRGSAEEELIGSISWWQETKPSSQGTLVQNRTGWVDVGELGCRLWAARH